MAKYYITGVWKDEQNQITNVLLHIIIDGGWSKGFKAKTKDAVSKFLVTDEVWTLVWDYHKSWWVEGKQVIVTKEEAKKKRNIAISFQKV